MENVRKQTMSKYINAEWLKAQVHDVVLANGSLHGCVDKLCIDEAPSIDIVRCKECRHYKVYDFAINSAKCCSKHDMWSNDDDYCAWGERRYKETDHE